MILVRGVPLYSRGGHLHITIDGALDVRHCFIAEIGRHGYWASDLIRCVGNISLAALVTVNDRDGTIGVDVGFDGLLIGCIAGNRRHRNINICPDLAFDVFDGVVTQIGMNRHRRGCFIDRIRDRFGLISRFSGTGG